jgi:curved DNA-binding protein
VAVAFRDYYDTLGVGRDASEEEIRRAYRKLARENHPDVNKDPGAEDRFKEIAEAYEVLRDPEKREKYDRLGENWKAGDRMGGGAGGPNNGGSEGFEGFEGFDFGGGGGGGGGGGFRDVQFEFGGGDFSDFFEGMFGARGGPGGGRARGAPRSARGGDQEAALELTLEEAARGGKRKITLGDGRDYEVNIPRGVKNGQRIRLAGEGGRGPGGGPAGDLYLRVRIKPHPRFRLDGRDLHTDLPVTPSEAALGAEVDIQTLEGTTRVKVPPGSSSGRKLRLRGQGMPDPRGQPGDLYARVMIHVPKKPSKKERELYEQLREVSNFNPRKGR